jgi:hypothetical protein
MARIHLKIGLFSAGSGCQTQSRPNVGRGDPGGSGDGLELPVLGFVRKMLQIFGSIFGKAGLGFALAVPEKSEKEHCCVIQAEMTW